MALPGETVGLQTGVPVHKGSAVRCSECREMMQLKVCMSAAGYYIGFECGRDGPYSRESGYYKTRELAQKALDTNTYTARGF